MDVLSRGLPKYLFLPEDTCLDKQSQYRAWACWVMASPMADRFDPTTSGAPSFSSAGSTVDIAGRPHLETAGQVHRWFLRGAPESDGGPRTICNWDRAAALRSSRH